MNDLLMLQIVLGLIGLYIATLIVQGIHRVYRWIFRDPIAPETEAFIEDWSAGIIPRDYSKKMKSAMEEVNAAQVGAAEDNDLDASDAAVYRFEQLKSIRTHVGHIRARGYRRGEADRQANKFDPEATPYPRGSGAAQQWVRGYCAGANVMDIKQYYDDA